MSAPACITVSKFRVEVTFEIAGKRHGIGFDLDDCRLEDAQKQYAKLLAAIRHTIAELAVDDSEEVTP